MCKNGMDPKFEDPEIALTLFHELVHVTTRVSDHPTKAYVKSDMVDLAV